MHFLVAFEITPIENQTRKASTTPYPKLIYTKATKFEIAQVSAIELGGLNSKSKNKIYRKKFTIICTILIR